MVEGDSLKVAERGRARRVLLAVDKPGWSYETIAKGLVRYNDDPSLELDVLSLSEDREEIENRQREYDLVFALGWTSVFAKKKKLGFRAELPTVEPDRIITGVHSHRAWDDYQSTPDFCPAPPVALIEKLGSVRGVNIISKRLYNLFRNAGLQNATLTENGVDAELFRPTSAVSPAPGRPLRVGFSGSKEIAKHDRLKGFSEFIEPLNRIAGVEVVELGGRGEKQVPRAAMPELYNQVDLYLCASSSEGFSQSVLEAAACSRAVISTRVGGSEDLIEHGLNGYLVDRDRKAIEQAVRRLVDDRELLATMGRQSRDIILKRYDWRLRVHDWLGFIRSNLEQTQQSRVGAQCA